MKVSITYFKQLSRKYANECLERLIQMILRMLINIKTLK